MSTARNHESAPESPTKTAAASTGDCLQLPRWLFILENAYLVVLLALGAWYISPHSSLAPVIGARIWVIPIGVPWWSTLGAVIVSLHAMYWHSGRNVPHKDRCWDPGYQYWHITKPLTGPAIGIVTYLLLVVVVYAASTGPQDGGLALATFYLAAFLSGYAEDQFHLLIRRAMKAILGAEAPDLDAQKASTEVTAHKIDRLKQLHSSGAITDDDFNTHKAKLLDRFRAGST